MNINDLLCPVCGGKGKMDGGPRPPSYSFDDEYEHDMIEAVGGYGEQPCPNGCVGVRVPYDHEDYGPGTVVTHLVSVIPWCETHNASCRWPHSKYCYEYRTAHTPCRLVAAHVEKVGDLA